MKKHETTNVIVLNTVLKKMQSDNRITNGTIINSTPDDYDPYTIIDFLIKQKILIFKDKTNDVTYYKLVEEFNDKDYEFTTENIKDYDLSPNCFVRGVAKKLND